MGITVLHVDDEPEFASLVADYLTRERPSFEVVTETSARDGLDRLAGTAVDCIVSDYQMPGMDGFDFLSAVRDEYPDLPFVLFTGKGSEEIASDAISAGVTDYLQKGGPERYTVLANRIEVAVSKFRARHNYRTIFEEATDGIAIHAPGSGKFLDVNRRFCEMIDRTREEVLSSSVGDVSADDPGYTEEHAVEEMAVAGREERHVTEWCMATPDGKDVPVEMTLTRTIIGGEERVLTVVRDVSERKRYERRLQALNEAHRRFVTAGTSDEVADVAVEVAERVLDQPYTVFWLFDDDRLVPVAATDPATELDASRDRAAGIDPLPPGSAEYRIFREGSPRLVDDYADLDDPGHPETPLGTLFAVPVADYGQLHVGFPEVIDLSPSSQELVELLARGAEAALQRVTE